MCDWANRCIKIQPQSKNSSPKMKDNPESTQNPISSNADT